MSKRLNIEGQSNAELPKGWLKITMGEACEINMGQSPPGNTYNSEGIGLPFFQGKAEFGSLHPEIRKWCSEPTKIAEPNDILLSIRAPIGPTNIANVRCCIGRGLCSIRYSPNYYFAYYYLKSVEQKLDSLGTGTTFKAISGEIVRAFPFNLPPLPEQHRIVEKLERLFARLTRAEAALAAAETALERYRQSVLNTAFKAEDEEGNMKEGWKWVKLGELITSITAGKSFRCEERPPINGELGIVKVSSVTWGTFNENESKTCFNNVVLNKSYKIKKGDFLFSRANTIQLVGACTIVEEITKNLMLSDKILRIDFKEKVDKTYVLHYLRSKNGRKEIERLASGNQESMRNIGQDRIKNISIPTPEFENQKMVSDNIDAALSRMSKLNFYIFQLRENCNNLRHSILQVAFSGRLVSQLEGEEPAEILLRRIKEAKQNVERKQPRKQKA